MRGSFSDIIRQKVEENSILKKTLIRLAAFSISLGLICSPFFYNVFNSLLFNAKGERFFIFLTVVMGSVLVGSLGGFLIFSNMFAHIKKVVSELSNENPRWEWLEKEYMESEIRNVYLAIKKLHFTVSSQSKLVGISQIATQVAHDIRSPLAAINIASADLTSIPENRRIMIKNASQRINDIANNLLLRAKAGISETNNNEKIDIFPELIFVVLDSIITEKRYEYDKRKINFHLNISESAYNCFCDINLEVFNRILSNLINNSIEAINSDGTVIVSLNSDTHLVEISIQDDGCGIPHDMLPNVMEHGFSFNKKNGAGLGLTYAKQQIEQIKGKITLQSTINIGTKVTIRLPRSDFPSWFCENININYNAKIIVLDDDPSIHDAWNERFNHLPLINIAHFYRESDLTKKNSSPLVDLYLVDYELLNDHLNGLDIIEKLKLGKHAILVTNCFENKKIRARCNELGVKIIPKPFVPYIPILILR